MAHRIAIPVSDKSRIVLETKKKPTWRKTGLHPHHRVSRERLFGSDAAPCGVLKPERTEVSLAPEAHRSLESYVELGLVVD